MLSPVEELARGRYDLLVVGGGIHGLFAAYDAAQRGVSVALVDRADFGSGLSFNHQRTIHGGLRALQTGNVRKTRQQIAERRAWARIAPHLLRPLPFLFGTYGWSTRSRLAVRLGFRLYDMVGRSRNAGVVPELHLPRTRLESAAATRRLFQGIAENGLSGGAIWYDYQTRHADRLTWTVALAAREAGATLVNYAAAVAPLKQQSRITGARVVDARDGREHAIEAKVTLIAAGAGTAATFRAFGLQGAPPMVGAMNLLLDRPARDIATAARAPSGRMLTAVPWQGYLLVGTHQSDIVVDGDREGHAAPPPDMLDACLDQVNQAFSRLRATRADIRLVHYGLTPAVVRRGRPELLPEPIIERHTTNGSAGVVSLVGVKYTTARLAAQHAVDAVCAELGGSHRRCRTGTTLLPFAGIADAEGRLVETLRDLGVSLDRDVQEHLTSWYSTESTDVVTFAAKHGLLERLTPGLPVLSGEIAYAAANAQAEHLADAVLRRTALAAAGHPGQAALEHAADVMGSGLGWTADRRAREIDETSRVFTAR